MTPWTAVHQASQSITNFWSLHKLMSTESVMPSNNLILCRPLLPLSIFPSIRVFSNKSGLLISSVQSLSHVRLFATPWTAARQASLSSTISRSLLKLMSVESVIPSNYLILCHLLLLLPFPASGSFPMSQFFELGGQSIRVSASASVLPVNS